MEARGIRPDYLYIQAADSVPDGLHVPVLPDHLTAHSDVDDRKALSFSSVYEIPELVVELARHLLWRLDEWPSHDEIRW